jgi:hypothetical protein
MEKYPIRIDTITCEYLINKRSALYPPSVAESLPKNDFDISQLDRHEMELILANWDGGQITLGQYLSQIKRADPRSKPNLDDYVALAKYIFQMKFEDLLKIEARQLGLENDDRYKRKIKRFKELTMADIMENDSLPQINVPDEGELRQYYEDNQGEFLIPAKAHIYEILFNDYSTAKVFAPKINSLEKFKEVRRSRTTKWVRSLARYRLARNMA